MRKIKKYLLKIWNNQNGFIKSCMVGLARTKGVKHSGPIMFKQPDSVFELCACKK